MTIADSYANDGKQQLRNSEFNESSNENNKKLRVNDKNTGKVDEHTEIKWKLAMATADDYDSKQ